jgi:hypothetical protein
MSWRLLGGVAGQMSELTTVRDIESRPLAGENASVPFA